MPDQRPTITIDEVVAKYSVDQILEGVCIQLGLRTDESLQEIFIAAHCKHTDAQRDTHTVLAVAREMDTYKRTGELPYTVTRQFLDYLTR